jgi:mono/diheme cytochrome c family protein
VAAGLLGVVVLAAACGGGSGSGSGAAAPRPKGTLASDPQVLEGRRLFVDYCASCHGIDGRGGVGPSFRGGKLLRDFATADDQVAFVRTGRGVMPSFGNQLSDAQLRAVVRYEREVVSPLDP